MSERLLSQLLLFALFSLGGWGIIGVGISGNIDMRRRMERERTRTTGEVVELVPSRKRARNGRDSWHPLVAFRADGQERRLESPDAYWPGQVNVGETVEILYDADDPSRFHLEKLQEIENTSGWVLIRSGIVWIVVAAIISLLAIR